MSTEENKALIHRWVAAFNAGDLDVIDEVYAPTYIDHTPRPGQAPGPAGVREALVQVRASFPDIHITIEDLIAEGDKVTTRWLNRATFQAPFRGRPPTGKPFSFNVIRIYRIEGGKIVEHWGLTDLAQQLEQQ